MWVPVLFHNILLTIHDIHTPRQAFERALVYELTLQGVHFAGSGLQRNADKELLVHIRGHIATFILRDDVAPLG